MNLWRRSIAVVALAGAAAAQRTWIVDAANGPGTDFTDLPPAEAAATNGDTLLVRRGSYTAFSTSKGICVLGVPGQTIVRGSFVQSAITVAGLPADWVFRARGLLMAGDLFQRLSLQSNEGAVHLETIDGAPASFPSPSFTIVVASCRVVTLVDCGHQSNNFGVHADQSRLALVHCRLQGSGALGDPRAGSRPASIALGIRGGAVVDVADGAVIGGAGASIWPHLGQYWPSAPAITLAQGAVVLRAGATASASAGVGVNPATPMSAIAGSGAAWIDSRFQLTSYAGAPLVEPGVQVVVGLVPGLSVTGGDLGGTVQLSHLGLVHQPCVLAMGFVGPVLSFPFGQLFLDLPTMQVLPVVFADGAGLASWTLPVPGNPALAGIAFSWQVGSDAGGLVLSNLVSVVLR